MVDKMTDHLHDEAANPETPSERLAELAKQSHLAPIIASNPNTPAKTLFDLADDHPHEFLANPILPLLHLENPSLFAHMYADSALRLLMCEEIPAWLLSLLAQHTHPAVRDT